MFIDFMTTSYVCSMGGAVAALLSVLFRDMAAEVAEACLDDGEPHAKYFDDCYDMYCYIRLHA